MTEADEAGVIDVDAIDGVEIEGDTGTGATDVAATKAKGEDEEEGEGKAVVKTETKGKRRTPGSASGVEEPPHKKKKAATGSGETTDFLAANSLYLASRKTIDEQTLELKKQQHAANKVLEKKKMKLNLARDIMSAKDDEINWELKEKAKNVLMKALEDSDEEE